MSVVKVYCRTCKHETNHQIVCEHRKTYQSGEFHADRVYQIVQCQGCDETSFREVSTNSEDSVPWGDEPQQKTTLYPPRGEGRLVARSFERVPHRLFNIYEETIAAFNDRLPILCAAGLRAVIEGICASQGVEGIEGTLRKSDGATEQKMKTNLEAKIDGLAARGLLTRAHAALLHEHRFIGNDALHDLRTVSRGALGVAIEIMEHTLYDLYDLQHKGGLLRSSRHTSAEGDA